MPVISVIIPTYNRADLLKETLESVLAQTFADYEVIVIDDGSTDNTEEVMSAFADHLQIRYIKQANAGVSAARNHGIFEARGEWIAFLDSDDLWFPDKLEKQMAFLAEHPSAGAVCCPAYIVSETSDGTREIVKDKNGEPLRQWGNRKTSILSCELFAVFDHVHTSSVLVQKTVLYKAGLFDCAWRIGEDLDLWVRIAYYSEFWYIDDFMGEYRKHERNVTTDKDTMRESVLRVKQFQMIRWAKEPDIARHFKKGLMNHYWGFAHQSHCKEENCREAARYYWLATLYADTVKVRRKLFIKFLAAKYAPFVFWIWDKWHKS